MPTVEFTRGFSAAHRIWNDPGLCKNIHGHNYRVVVRIESLHVDASGFVVPFDYVKGIIDRFDHALILDAADPLYQDGTLAKIGLRCAVLDVAPSTEMLAAEIAGKIREAVPDAKAVTVTVHESDSIQATAVA